LSVIVARQVLPFRDMVDSIPKTDARVVLKFAYETGGRVNEIATKGATEYLDREVTDRKTGQKHHEVKEATRPMGPKASDVVFDTYEGEEVMTVTMTVLKRRVESATGGPVKLARIVGLPLGFDPWVKELADYVSMLKPDEGIIPYNRRDISEMLLKSGMTAQALFGAPPGYKMLNPLRHVRLNHLESFYGFGDEYTRRFFGWTYMAPGGSSTQRSYEALNWQFYFPKLLKPLPRRAALSPEKA
jgi:hypothetical protein